MIPEAQEVPGITANHSRGDGFADAKLYSIEERMGLWRKLTASGANHYLDQPMAATGDPSDPKFCRFSPSVAFDNAAAMAGYGVPPTTDPRTEEFLEPTAVG